MTFDRRSPLIVEVSRGNAVESRHRVDAAVVDADGSIVEAFGDVERAIFPRSSIKPIQAMPLLELGIADRYAFSDAEIALACASHGAQQQHVAGVRSLLHRCGLEESALECGGHLPTHVPSAHEMIRAGAAPTAIHNGCSGKHAGFICTAKAFGEPIQGYVEPDHPVQRRVAAAIGDMTGCRPRRQHWGTDGCSAPTIPLPLRQLACGIAQFADPSGLGAQRRTAVERIFRAMTSHPFMVAGDERLCTALMTAADGRVMVKFGAEGVFVAALPDRGLGLALKAEDGATRAAEAALIFLLQRLGALAGLEQQTALLHPTSAVHNWRGQIVGSISVRHPRAHPDAPIDNFPGKPEIP